MEFESMKLSRTAKMVVEVNAGVKAGENVCIVTDTNKLSIAQALANACCAVGAETVVCIMTPRQMHGNKPPAVVAAAMKGAQCVVVATTHKITHSDATVEALKAGARMFILSDVTEDIFTSGAMTANYEEIYTVTSALAKRLSAARQVRMTSPLGSELTMSVAGRQALCLAGMFRDQPRAALPDGEAAITPVEGTAQGILVVDHAGDGIGLLQQPIKLVVEKGQVVRIEGGAEAQRLREIVQGAGEGGNNIAEFAIGTNPLARMLGNVAEDKKRLGTIHVALGDNQAIGGKSVSQIHLDLIVLNPTVWLDGQEVVTRGVLNL